MIKPIEYGSQIYVQMVKLRSEVLREPLGLKFAEEDLKKDTSDCLIGYFAEDGGIVGCCILSKVNDNTLQLRQMAVDTRYQRNNIGSELLAYVEVKALKEGFRYLYLHARKVAVGFYTRNGYMLESDEFEEVGVPHFEMLKMIGR